MFFAGVSCRIKLCTCCFGFVGKLGIDGYVKKVVEYYFNLCYFLACFTNKQNCFLSWVKGLVLETPKILYIFFWQTVATPNAYILSTPLFVRVVNVMMLGHEIEFVIFGGAAVRITTNSLTPSGLYPKFVYIYETHTLITPRPGFANAAKAP